MGLKLLVLEKNILEASKPMILNINHKTIGILSAAENEDELASDYEPGANSLDCFRIAKTIYNDMKTCDVKIIILHGGREFFRYPSPRMKNISKNLIDSGASCILWQHSHCTSGTEYYKDGFISYGQGNFIFNYDIKYNNFFRGYLVQIDIDFYNKTSYKIIPYDQHCNSNGIDLMKDENLIKFNTEIEELNSVICDDAALIEKWNNYCIKVCDNYLSELFGYGKFF
uniref:CapA family protein n=1 Tax=Clostridium sp. NkU-1 TaxID=1095009 RepID=UPI0032618D80